MNNNELIAKLKLLERRQKDILGNQVAILERLELESKVNTKHHKVFDYNEKWFIRLSLLALGFSLVLAVV